MPNSNRVPRQIVTGSGVAGPMVLVTSGQLLDRNSAGCTFFVTYNMDGSAGSGADALANGAITALSTPGAGTRSPLLGGAPAGVFLVEGSSDNVYYSDVGVTVSSLFGVASSGIRNISIAGALPDYVRLRYANTSSSGVFNVWFSSHGLGAGS